MGEGTVTVDREFQREYAEQLVDTFGGGEPLKVDDFGTITVKQVGDEVVQVIPMIFNDRIVIGTDPELGYEHGWCYDKGALALLVAMTWDPLVDAEPWGYKKRATPGMRRVPVTS